MDKLLNLCVDDTKLHVNLTRYLYYSLCYNNYYRLGQVSMVTHALITINHMQHNLISR